MHTRSRSRFTLVISKTLFVRQGEIITKFRRLQSAVSNDIGWLTSRSGKRGFLYIIVCGKLVACSKREITLALRMGAAVDYVKELNAKHQG